MKKFGDFKIESNIVSVIESSSMAETVALMIEKKVSSVLVTDTDGKVTGILTERDIVRKFTLVDVKDKLSRTVGTVMGRGVKFVSPDSIVDDVMNLHFELGMRHFPIAKGLTPHIKDVTGIISVSDILRSFLKEKAQKNIADKKIELPIRIGLLARSDQVFDSYVSQFSGFPIAFFKTGDLSAFIRENGADKFQLFIDLDGFNQNELRTLIQTVAAYRGNRIVAMSQPAMVATLAKMIEKPDRHLKVCMKPVDPTYCNWLFTEKWKS